MARVHMFKSSADKQKDVSLPEEELPASPSLIQNTTTEENSSLDVTASANQLNQNESAALTAALLQKASSNMDVVGAVAAALSIKPDSLEMLSERTQQQLLSSLQQHQQLQQKQQQQQIDQHQQQQSSTDTALQSTQSTEETSSGTTTASIDNTERIDGQNKDKAPESTAKTDNPESNVANEFMDQAAAATALQLLGLAQQSNMGKPEGSNSTSTTATEQTQPQLDSSVMMIANYPGLNTQNLSSSSTQQQQQVVETAIEEMSQKRGAWTREEDDLLLAGIKKFGYGRWKEIASIIPGRKGKQLKQRWDNTLAAKYVDQEWLQNKIRDAVDVRDNKRPLTTSTPPLVPALQPANTMNHGMELADWTTIAQKISEKLKEGDQVAIENIISQALLSTISSAAAATANNNASSSSTSTNFKSNTTTPMINFNDPSSLALFTSQQQQQQQQQQTQTNDHSAAGGEESLSSHSFYIPPPSPKKRRRSDPALADTQSDAMSIYASATPITTTVNNQTQTFYPCLFPDCGKTFARLYNLKSHSRTHTDDRPFICQVCHIAFSRNHDLKRHSKIHGGDKPFRCAGCNKTFSRLDALKRHKSNQRNKATCVNAPIIQ